MPLAEPRATCPPKNRRGIVVSLLLFARAAAVGYLLVLLGLLTFENWLVYPAPPRERGNWDPPQLHKQDVYFTSTDGTKLHGWYVEHPQPVAHLLFCHGNGEHVGDIGPLLYLLNQRLQVSVFAFDYRGYGRSEGKPHEQGVLADGHAAQLWLADKAGIQPDEVVVMGQSLGGGVAVDLAANNGARGLVLDRTFTSLPDAAAATYFWVPVQWMMRNRMNSQEKIAAYDGPLLQCHGTADRIVPYRLGEALFRASPSENKNFITFDGGRHNMALPMDYYDTLSVFLQQLPPPQSLEKEEPHAESKQTNMLNQLETSLVYPAPRYPEGDWNPAGLDHEDVYFQAADGVKLHGWYVEHDQPRAAVLYSHGNGEHVAYQAPLLKFLRDELRVSAFAYDYRGYGRSEGTPDEQGLLADARAARAWLAERVNTAPENIVLMGRSLGGAVSVALAAQDGARALILESTFTSMPDVAARLFPWLPVRSLMRNQFDSLAKIGDYQGPLLQSHGTRDNIVAYELGAKLFAASTSPQKEFFEIRGGDHNDPSPPEYYAALDRFLDRLP